MAFVIHLYHSLENGWSERYEDNALCGLAGLAFLTAAATADEPREEKGKGRLLERYDANKDGKLDEAEKAKAKEEFVKRAGPREGRKLSPEVEGRLLEKFDANKNGKLDDDEKAKAREEHMKHRTERGKAGEGRDKLMSKYDANGDGKLDEAEKAKAREEFGKNRPARKPK